MDFITIAKIGAYILRPLVSLREHDRPWIMILHIFAHLLQKGMRFWQILTVGSFPFKQVGDGIRPEAVQPHIQPEFHHPEHFLLHLRVVIIQIRLRGIKSVPVILLALLIPGPIRVLRIQEDDPGLFVQLVGVAPDIIIPVRRVLALPRLLKPFMLVRSVIHDQVDNNLQPLFMNNLDQGFEIFQRPIIFVYPVVIRYIIPIIL